MLVKFRPPPNDQKLDTKIDFDGYVINGSSQCQGNSNEDCLKAIAVEFNIKELENINTFAYYTLFRGVWQGQKNFFPNRTQIMDYRNHAWFLNQLFKSQALPIRAIPQEIKNDPMLVHKAIEKTRRPVSIGTLLSQSGHWISVHGSNDIEKVFNCNDPFGQHPYKKDQIGGYVDYTWEYLKKFTIRRMISFQDIQEKKK